MSSVICTLLLLSPARLPALLSTSFLSSSVWKVTLSGGQPPTSHSVGMSLVRPVTFISRLIPRLFLYQEKGYKLQCTEQILEDKLQTLGGQFVKLSVKCNL